MSKPPEKGKSKVLAGENRTKSKFDSSRQKVHKNGPQNAQILNGLEEGHSRTNSSANKCEIDEGEAGIQAVNQAQSSANAVEPVCNSLEGKAGSVKEPKNKSKMTKNTRNNNNNVVEKNQVNGDISGDVNVDVLVLDRLKEENEGENVENAAIISNLGGLSISQGDENEGPQMQDGGLEIDYVQYQSELQMPMIMKIIQKDLSEPYSIYTYRYFIHNWPNLCFLAMSGTECVGAIVCKLDLYRKVIKRGYIAMLAVDKNFRKHGIGSTLVRRAIQEMVVGDADEVVLETEITNKPALRLYEALGFVRDKRLFRYYLNGVDALRLKLWLR